MFGHRMLKFEFVQKFRSQIFHLCVLPPCNRRQIFTRAAFCQLKTDEKNHLFSLAVPSKQFTSSAVVCKARSKLAESLVKQITKDDLTISFARSGGAGGQNVNKVNTKVDLRLNIDKVNWLTDDMREELRRKEKGRINKEGEIVVTSTRTRSQVDNLEDAMEKLQTFIDAAAEAVQPRVMDEETKKQLAKQKKIANENRLKEKKVMSQKKGDRRAKIDW